MPDPSVPARPPQISARDEAIATAILTLVEARGADSSICPSEVARALDPAWRPLMNPVRQAAIRLAAAGRIDILRKGRPAPPGEVRGVIRLRLRRDPALDVALADTGPHS